MLNEMMIRCFLPAMLCFAIPMRQKKYQRIKRLSLCFASIPTERVMPHRELLILIFSLLNTSNYLLFYLMQYVNVNTL